MIVVLRFHEPDTCKEMAYHHTSAADDSTETMAVLHFIAIVDRVLRGRLDSYVTHF
jgi:hypothetical protein